MHRVKFPCLGYRSGVVPFLQVGTEVLGMPGQVGDLKLPVDQRLLQLFANESSSGDDGKK